jgi:alpha-mannosidase
MNNYWFTNYKAGRGGNFTFRFSFTSRRKADTVASARFGWAVSNPLLATRVEGNVAGALTAPAESLVEIAEPNVILIAAKQAEESDALVLRLWEVSGRSTTAHVRLKHRPMKKATACSLVEEPQTPLAIDNETVAVPIRGAGLATVMIE